MSDEQLAAIRQQFLTPQPSTRLEVREYKPEGFTNKVLAKASPLIEKLDPDNYFRNRLEYAEEVSVPALKEAGKRYVELSFGENVDLRPSKDLVPFIVVQGANMLLVGRAAALLGKGIAIGGRALAGVSEALIGIKNVETIGAVTGRILSSPVVKYANIGLTTGTAGFEGGKSYVDTLVKTGNVMKAVEAATTKAIATTVTMGAVDVGVASSFPSAYIRYAPIQDVTRRVTMQTVDTIRPYAQPVFRELTYTTLGPAIATFVPGGDLAQAPMVFYTKNAPKPSGRMRTPTLAERSKMSLNRSRNPNVSYGPKGEEIQRFGTDKKMVRELLRQNTADASGVLKERVTVTRNIGKDIIGKDVGKIESRTIQTRNILTNEKSLNAELAFTQKDASFTYAQGVADERKFIRGGRQRQNVFGKIPDSAVEVFDKRTGTALVVSKDYKISLKPPKRQPLPARESGLQELQYKTTNAVDEEIPISLKPEQGPISQQQNKIPGFRSRSRYEELMARVRKKQAELLAQREAKTESKAIVSTDYAVPASQRPVFIDAQVPTKAYATREEAEAAARLGIGAGREAKLFGNAERRLASAPGVVIRVPSDTEGKAYAKTFMGLSIKPKTGNELINQPGISYAYAEKLATAEATLYGPAIREEQGSSQVQQRKTDQEYVIDTQQVFETVVRTPDEETPQRRIPPDVPPYVPRFPTDTPPYKPRIPDEEIIEIPLPKKSKLKLPLKKKGQQGFDVFGKVRGKEIKLNLQPLSLSQAKAVGARKIETTAARTFRIAESGEAEDAETFGFKFNPRKYVQKGERFIQKSKFAISSPGEKQEITAKGIQALKMKAGRFKI